MVWDIVFLVAGLVLLFFGGEGLVRGSVSLADRFGISKIVVGMVIVGFGTSAPELLVSLQAALSGSPDIAIGNVVGSNIANVLLIVGLAALIAPVSNNDLSIRRDGIVMVAVSLVLLPLLFIGRIGLASGVFLLTLLILYLATTYILESRRRASVFVEEASELKDIAFSPALAIVAVVSGLVMLVFGARLMVEGATGIARLLGISEAVIGLTVVAVGTSLPELATAIVAAIRKHSDVVLANVIGSNIFNILCILGLTAVVSPIPVTPRFAAFDGPVMAAVAIAATAGLFLLRTIGRAAASALLAAYAVYLLLQ